MRTKIIGNPQTKKAETLLSKIGIQEAELAALEKQQNKELDKLLAQHKKAKQKYLSKISTLNASLKENCSHPVHDIKDDFDYHRREEWTITSCTVCKKQLSRV